MKNIQVIDENNNVLASFEEDDKGDIKGIAQDNIRIYVDGKELDNANK